MNTYELTITTDGYTGPAIEFYADDNADARKEARSYAQDDVELWLEATTKTQYQTVYLTITRMECECAYCEESAVGVDEDGDPCCGECAPATGEPPTGETVIEDHTPYLVAVKATEPDCADRDHEWESPHEVVGGCDTNPGVHGHGGGVVVREVCRHCGIYRVTDTWAQDRATGEQGLTSVEYEDADDASLAWVRGDKDESADDESAAGE